LFEYDYPPSIDEKAKKSAPEFQAGDQVEAQYKGMSQWYAGEIAVTNSDGTYHIKYEDGEEVS
jgi:hypothetical protein